MTILQDGARLVLVGIQHSDPADIPGVQPVLGGENGPEVLLHRGIAAPALPFGELYTPGQRNARGLPGFPVSALNWPVYQ